MIIKNIIFDFGGVLIDWNPERLYKKIFENTEELEYFLANICNLEWNTEFDAGKPFQEGVDELSEKFPKYKNEIQMYNDRWIEMIKGEISANTELLKPLSKTYNLYGLTNWSAEKFPTAYEMYDFFKTFKGIVVSGTEKMVKPDYRIYKLLLSRYKLKPQESIFIDDNISNIKAANTLGINTIHYTNNTNLKDELNKLGII